ncbi:MAG: hypothetical protein B6244_11150 [Candidatus Cloacimonetes bacterium 4572_55]|nr:MAG: hypothetical protein B6244_11150 [Candidatus Cloacimonetes bacterium 4572_55]
MTNVSRLSTVLFFTLLFVMTPLFSPLSAGSDGLSYQRWGVRGGFSFDVDQILLGAHVDLGTVLEDRLRFEPNAELGFGDNHITVGVAADLKYLFEGEDFVPYLIGGIQLTHDNFDVDSRNHGSDSKTSIALNMGGGLSFPIDRREYFVDIRLGVIKPAHSFRIVVGTFFD